jgi:GT2 family glycosyltransferase
MDLSVVIVSYNVKYFLEQCLCSVQRAAGNGVEVWVVDNHSADGTVEYLQPRFPFVHFIRNAKNAGFARANNQVLQMVGGKYVLFLNPDTIIPEDLFTVCTAFLESHADAGALGVRMIDGSGRFLKESKRGFPSPWVAFCKMSGLTKLFPRSATFARYYMGHLSEEETQVVDALAGACMFVRKTVLEKLGGFDEQFFMYAEDIDLSYRIQQKGYKNYYLPEATIIHFKGESTRKDNRYIKQFYKAMIQFVRKHFHGASVLYILLLKIIVPLKVAYAGIFHSYDERPETKSRPGKSLLVGERPVIEKLAVRMQEEGKIEFLENYAQLQNKKAGTIIFCESPALSFKNIIRFIHRSGTHARCKISAAGSDSIVGSTSKFSRGEAMGL